MLDFDMERLYLRNTYSVDDFNTYTFNDGRDTPDPDITMKSSLPFMGHKPGENTVSKILTKYP